MGYEDTSRYKDKGRKPGAEEVLEWCNGRANETGADDGGRGEKSSGDGTLGTLGCNKPGNITAR